MRMHEEEPARSQPPRATGRTADPAPLPPTAALVPQVVLDLQRTVGNAATADLVEVQRAPTRTARTEVNKDNALDRCGAAAYDSSTQAITPGKPRRADLLKKIVWENHWAPISAVCAKHKYTIAVRETGEYSIRRIEKGAKAKPHTILEKSIKPSSVDKKYPAGNEPGQAGAVLTWLKENDLEGFVGHWGAGGLLGVRIDHPPQTVQDAGIVHRGANGEQYVPLDMNAPDGGPQLERLKDDPKWKQYLYTGDYDLHEAYAAQGGTGGGQIPEATPEKVKLLNRLNAGVERNTEGVEGQPPRHGEMELTENRVHVKDGSEYAMFQHGDQATYRMNQYLESELARRATQLVKAVATESDEPLAWCRMGQWYVSTNREEHAALRARWNLHPPHTWNPEEVKRTESGGYRTTAYTG